MWGAGLHQKPQHTPSREVVIRSGNAVVLARSKKRRPMICGIISSHKATHYISWIQGQYSNKAPQLFRTLGIFSFLHALFISSDVQISVYPFSEWLEVFCVNQQIADYTAHSSLGPFLHLQNHEITLILILLSWILHQYPMCEFLHTISQIYQCLLLTGDTRLSKWRASKLIDHEFEL